MILFALLFCPQLVWADTYTVGCGMAECTGIADQDNAAIDNILVCNYGDG